MQQTPAPIEPEDRDWTFVITAGCDQCGFDARYDASTTGARLRASIPRWESALRRPDAATRSAPTTWSALEYACHVRDGNRIFRERLGLMLHEDDPEFLNWDQDSTAVSERYWAQDPSAVARQYAAEASSTASAFDAVRGAAWDRSGRRSNGSIFTVRTLAPYFLHDIEHHLHDVGA